jgi:hypothetical protein
MTKKKAKAGTGENSPPFFQGGVGGGPSLYQLLSRVWSLGCYILDYSYFKYSNNAIPMIGSNSSMIVNKYLLRFLASLMAAILNPIR